MTDIETIDDEILDAEREEGRQFVKSMLLMLVAGSVGGSGIAAAILQLPIMGTEAMAAIAAASGATMIFSGVAYPVYRISEDWILERAVKQGHIEDTETHA